MKTQSLTGSFLHIQFGQSLFEHPIKNKMSNNWAPLPPTAPGSCYPVNGLGPNRQDPLQANNIMAPWVLNMPPILKSPFAIPYYISELNLGRRNAIPAPYNNGCGNRKSNSNQICVTTP